MESNVASSPTHDDLPSDYRERRARHTEGVAVALLRGGIDVIEWHEDPADPKQAKALIRMFPVVNFWNDSGVKQDGVGSSSRKDWLAKNDSNAPPSSCLSSPLGILSWIVEAFV